MKILCYNIQVTTHSASSAVQTAQSVIETISQAAAELSRLYAAFDKAAVDLTTTYIKQRLAGEEDVTWAMFPKFGLKNLRRPTPILDTIVRQKEAILLGAGYNMWSEVLKKYQLTMGAMLIPGSGETFVKVDAITIRRSAVGYNPGDEHIVAGDQVLKAGYDHHRSVPTVGTDRNLAWSVPRNWVNGTFRALTEVDSDLQQAIKDLRGYELSADSAV